MNWQTTAFLQLLVKGPDRTLLVQVDPVTFSLLAFETRNPTVKGRKARQAAILDNHAHKLIGQAHSLRGAVDWAERFAAQWEKGVPLPQCDCTEVLK